MFRVIGCLLLVLLGSARAEDEAVPRRLPLPAVAAAPYAASGGPGHASAPDRRGRDEAPGCGNGRRTIALGRDLVRRGEPLVPYGVGVFLVVAGKAFIALGYVVQAVELASC